MKKNTRYKLFEQLLSEPGKNKVFSRAAIICSIGAVFVAVMGLLGWVPSLSFLGNISPHFIPMAPTTSICFILLGLIVLIQIRYRLRGWSWFSAVAVTLLLSVFGIMELAEQFYPGFDIEDFFIPDAGLLGSMRKARMSPATGATFFLSGIATLLMLLGETKNKQVKRICSWSGIVGSLVTITGITILMSYLYRDPLLYGSQTIPMAVTTAIGFVFLGVGLVAVAGPDNMPVRLLVGSSSRAKLLRAFLPLSILIVLSQDILHRFVFASFQINSVLLSVLSLMFFAAITGVIVTVMAGVIGRALDIAEKKNKALSKFPSENPNPVLRIAKDGEVLYSNQAGELLLIKWESGVGKTVPEKWRNLIAEAFKSQRVKEEEEEVNDRIFSLVIAPVKEAGYANLYARDMTEHKKAVEKAQERQAELLHMSRLTTIGEMASGLAHELNQPLSAISSYSTACMNTIKSGEFQTEIILDDLQMVVGQARRAGEIIQRIRDFLKKGMPHRSMVDINDIIENTMVFVANAIKKCQVQLKVELSDQLPAVLADPIQLEQVFLNIVYNAIEAMADLPPRKRLLTVQTRMQADENVEVVVCDCGIGVSDEVAEKIFDSFFTTKPEGLGMGLSISRTIIEAHNGMIFVQPGRTEGTEIVIQLPV